MGNNLCPKIYSANNEPEQSYDTTSCDVSEVSSELSEEVMLNSPRKKKSILSSIDPNQTIITKKFAPRIECSDKVYYNHEIYKGYFHIINFNDKIIIFFNNNSRKFPIKGWFQKCFSCETPTGQLECVTGNIYVRVCEGCKNKKWTQRTTDELEDVLDIVYEY